MEYLILLSSIFGIIFFMIYVGKIADKNFNAMTYGLDSKEIIEVYKKFNEFKKHG